MGCLMAGGIIVVVVIAAVLGGGYYALMHTSLPFKPFEEMINSSGKAEIKGLKGALASGFSVDEFRIFKTGLNDTYFTDISFKYNGMRDIEGNNRFIINEFHIAKVFISLPTFESEEGEDGSFVLQPAFESPELDEALSGERLGESVVFEIKSFRIDEFVIENSDGERKNGSVSLTDFKVDPSGVTLGDLQVSGDYIEMKLEELPKTNPYRQAISGSIKAAIDAVIRKDIVFSVEFGGPGNAKKARYSIFDGKILVTSTEEGLAETTITGLTLADYLDPKVADLPADVSLTLTSSKNGQSTEIGGGSFLLGKTLFEVAPQELLKGDVDGNKMTAIAEIDGKEVVMRIAEPKDGERHFTYEFSSEGIDAAGLVAQVLFQKASDDLNEDEKQVLETFASRHLDTDLKPEPVDK